MKHPEDDVSISNGHGFLVTTAPYARHLRVAKTIKEVSEYISDSIQWLKHEAEGYL